MNAILPVTNTRKSNEVFHLEQKNKVLLRISQVAHGIFIVLLHLTPTYSFIRDTKVALLSSAFCLGIGCAWATCIFVWDKNSDVSCFETWKSILDSWNKNSWYQSVAKTTILAGFGVCNALLSKYSDIGAIISPILPTLSIGYNFTYLTLEGIKNLKK